MPVKRLLYLTGVMNTPRPHVYDLRHMYASLRYGWAFPNTANLLLDAGVQEIDTHQKTLMSDEIGAGFAGYALYRLGCTHFIEADRLIKVGVARYKTKARRKQPDYVGFNIKRAFLAVVEAKGSQSSMAMHRNQLKRGKEQVANLAFSIRHFQRHDLVSAVLLRRAGANAGRTLWSVHDPDPPQREAYEIADPSLLLRLHYASLLRFIGADTVAANLEEGREKFIPPLSLTARAATTITEGRIEDRVYQGRVFPSTHFGNTHEPNLFVGLHRETANRWLAGEEPGKGFVLADVGSREEKESTFATFPDGGIIMEDTRRETVTLGE